MSYGFLGIAAAPSVRAARAAMGSDCVWQDFKNCREFDRFIPDADVKAVQLDANPDLATLVAKKGAK